MVYITDTRRPWYSVVIGRSGIPMLKPEDLFSFVESKGFRGEWRDCGLSDDDLWSLQSVILATPKAGQVVPGTGGLRKLRFTPPGSGRGKSGSRWQSDTRSNSGFTARHPKGL